MDDRAAEFRVGVVLVASVIVAGILMWYFGEFGGVVNKQYSIYVRFDEAPGVTVDTPVRKSGILIGRVTQVDLIKEGGVLVTARVDSSRTIARNEICKITTGTILGDAELEFVRGEGQVPVTDIYNDGDYMDGVVGQNPLNALGSFMDVLTGMEGEIKDALTSIKGAGEDVGQAANSLNGLLSSNQDRITNILIKAENSMDRFDFAMSSIEEFVRDDELKSKVMTAFDQVPQLLTDARDLMATLKSAAARLDKNLDNIEGFTEPLGQAGQQLFARGETVMERVDNSLKQIDELTAELVTFSQSLNSSESTIGQLTRSRELYDRINRTAANIEEVSAQLRPIVNDARVFTDKIARNPGRLGLQGALQRQQSGLKY